MFLVEFAFVATDLVPLSAARLPSQEDLLRLADAGDALWRLPIGTGANADELDLRFAAVAAFPSSSAVTRRSVVRSVPVPMNATHFRIVSERVVHREFFSDKMDVVVAFSDGTTSPVTPTLAEMISRPCSSGLAKFGDGIEAFFEMFADRHIPTVDEIKEGFYRRHVTRFLSIVVF